MCGGRPDEEPLAGEGRDEEGQEDCVSGAVHAGGVYVRDEAGAREVGRRGDCRGCRWEGHRLFRICGKCHRKRLHLFVMVDIM